MQFPIKTVLFTSTAFAVLGLGYLLANIAHTTPPDTQEERDAISAINGLYSKINVGMNIMQYSQVLQDTKPVVDKSGDPELEDIIQGHIVALDWWRCNLDDHPDYCRDQQLPFIRKRYIAIDINLSRGVKSIDLDENRVLKAIWAEELKKIMAIACKQEDKQECQNSLDRAKEFN
jgi:hypothetical protein